MEDSHIVSFPKLDKEKEALRRKTQGERVPFETENVLTSLTSISGPPPMAFTDPSDFDEVIKEGDEYLSRVEEELENEGKKQVLTRVEKGFAKTVKWETINFPLNQLMKYHLRLPFPHAPKVLSRNPKMWVSKTPILEHPAVLIAIPEWENKNGTKCYAVDVKEGYIYAVRSEDWERLVERAYVAIEEPLDPDYVTPAEKELSAGKVQTLDSKEKVPIAESTRKDLKEPIQKGRGIPGTDFLDSEPRHKVPDKELETPKRKLSFEDSTDDEQIAEEIEKDIKDAKQAQWALETERMQIEIERVTLERERQRIAEERLKALRQQRKKLEESIIKMSNEMSRDEVVHLATAAYNFFPNEHSRESPFFLMFGRDPRIPLNTLLEPKIRYMGMDENILSLEALQRIYYMVAENLKLARERQTKQKPYHPIKLKTEDMVMIKTHADGQFQPIYKGYYRIVSFKGNQVQVILCEGGKPHFVHITDVKYVLPADNVISHIPTFNQFGRKTKLNLNPDVVPDLKWKVSDTLNTKTPIIPIKVEKVNTQTTQLTLK